MSNYKQLNLQIDHNVSSLHNNNSFKTSEIPSTVFSLCTQNLNLTFTKIREKKDFYDQNYENYSEFISSVGELYVLSRNDIFPYFDSFRTLQISSILVEMLGPNYDTDNQNVAINTIINLIKRADPSYKNDLIQANIVTSLIDLYSKRSDDNYIIVLSFAYLLKNNIDVRKQILENIHISAFIAPVVSISFVDIVKTYLFFLSSVAQFNDMPDEILILFLSATNELLKYPQYIFKASKMLDIINEYTPRPIFQPYVRSSGMLCSALNALSNVAKEKSTSLLNEYLIKLLIFVGIIFENPVDEDLLNLQMFIDLSVDKRTMVRQAAIFAVGNLFESMPEMISKMAQLYYFEALEKIINTDSDFDTKSEYIVCCATAICFTNAEMREMFLKHDFLNILCETANSFENKLPYIKIRAIMILLGTLEINNGPFVAIQEFEKAGGFDMMTSFNEKEHDEKTTVALSELEQTISNLNSQLIE